MVEDVMLREVLSQLTGHDMPGRPEAREDRLLSAVQSPTENPRLEFRDGQFFLSLTTPAGALVERYLSNASVREAFSRIPIDSGWLPPEVVRWGDGKAGEWAVAFFAPAVYELEIERELTVEDHERNREVGRVPTGESRMVERIGVPLPGLVFFGTRRPIARDDAQPASDHSATNYFVWAVKTGKLDPFQEIYRAPLPNVYADGRVCWGLVKPPRPTSRSIIPAFELFIKSTFNNHLANGKSKREKEDVRVMLRELSGRWAVGSGQLGVPWTAEAVHEISEGRTPPAYSVFPVDDLLRQVPHTGITLDTALREFMETGVMAE